MSIDSRFLSPTFERDVRHGSHRRLLHSYERNIKRAYRQAKQNGIAKPVILVLDLRCRRARRLLRVVRAENRVAVSLSLQANENDPVFICAAQSETTLCRRSDDDVRESLETSIFPDRYKIITVNSAGVHRASWPRFAAEWDVASKPQESSLFLFCLSVLVTVVSFGFLATLFS